MTRLAFLADPHADDLRQKVDAATGLNAAFVDALGILRWVARDAHERGCEALVVCGDLTEQRHPAPWRVALIGEALAKFPGPVHLLRGNHDSQKADRSIVDVLAAGRPGWHGYARPGVATTGDTAIAFLPWVDRHWLRAQPGFEAIPDAEVYHVLGEQWLALARGLYVEASGQAEHTVLACHQTLSGGRMSEAQEAFLGDLSLVVDTGALAAIGFDAVIAGHLHRHQVIHEDPLVAYVGSPHRVDWGEEHGGAKGYLVVEGLEPVPSWTFVPTPARRFLTMTGPGLEMGIEPDPEGAIVRVLDLSPEQDPAAIRRQLEEAGAFEVTEIRHARVEAPEVAGGLSESLTAHEAVAAHFEGDPDREALIERANAVLAEVAG